MPGGVPWWQWLGGGFLVGLIYIGLVRFVAAFCAMSEAPKMAMRSCPYPGCARRIESDRYACQPHWYLLPRPMRDAIWAAWQSGDWDDLRDAHATALAFYVEHAGRIESR